MSTATGDMPGRDALSVDCESRTDATCSGVAKRMLGGYVIRRLGEPVDAANLVLFLASDAASWVTGPYPVHGGYSFAV